MKIDEACINHNFARLTKEIMGSPWEYSDQEDFADHMRILTLGYIAGMTDFADAIKAVLKE